MKKQVGLLLGALLVGCGSPSAPGYTVRGNVLLPSGVALGTSPAGGTAADVADLDALWQLPHVPGEVLLETGTGGLGAQALTVLSGVRLQAVPGTDLQLAATPAGETDAAFARRLAGAGVRAQPNFVYQALAVPNDPGFPGDNRPGVKVGGVAYDQDYLTRIDALGGWNRLEALGKTVDGALTAVLDTGVDRSHPELAGRLRPGFDFCSKLVGQACQGTDNDPSEVTAGDVGHGTSSAGLIAANTNNGVGLASLTWRGTVLPVKVFGTNGTTSSATSASVTAGLRYATDQGARVINMSLGFSGGQVDPALSQAIRDAAAADIVLVAAAGNTRGDGLYYPASDPNVLAVGALSQDDNTLACYSARPLPGQKPLDLVAPGGQAGSDTTSCYISSPYDILTLTTVQNGSYTLRAGTSEAAPQVSGTAALLRAAFPGLTADQIRQALKQGARTTGAGAMLNVTGAVNRAASLVGPPSSGKAYTLNVRALSGDQQVMAKTFQGTLTASQKSVPYVLSGLPAGTYQLRATLQVEGQAQPFSGSAQVTVPSGSGGEATQDIQTQR
ncbi:hypothetical protein E5F05_03150 (plasmid) [Deinococcus metallilatus]|uniref:Serine protease n=1 Tax=Deinococcus metallilatus TaxID=1211322 RepID=A0AAJ5JZU7_9DEIO|nr:S8 family serine peptidase [Deinococcus metallilatus]MBB5297365.1 serine protease [Deinococcus metallilatus]QBY06930.1 hypothetical protein E5F05_03150 [Deinococcus metallilatus]TLK32320.1 hypothetical protein FCS05_02485 [Deinococcus metallilatus]